MMETPRDVLNEIKWRYEPSLNETEIYYVHRGAKGDFKVMNGSEIEELGRSFINCVEGHIPYHRVFKIIHKGEVVFSRERD
ncbi:MAG: DUF504 domain-containing protein [Thermoplasmatota archaeon]